MTYVDGFVVPVPTKKLKAYLAMARKAGKVWKEHGATDYQECAADDVKPGKWTSFPQSVKLKKGEPSFSRGSPINRASIATAWLPRS